MNTSDVLIINGDILSNGDERVGNYAIFSPCKTWRYELGRMLDPSNPTLCVFLMLNPSTAEEFVNDPTVKRTINYVSGWGYGQLVVANIFSYRATDPADMKAVDDPVGVLNDAYIAQILQRADRLICAWGNHGAHLERDLSVMNLIKANFKGQAMCLKETGGGFPGHPLYLKADCEPLEYHGRQ